MDGKQLHRREGCFSLEDKSPTEQNIYYVETREHTERGRGFRLSACIRVSIMSTVIDSPKRLRQRQASVPLHQSNCVCGYETRWDHSPAKDTEIANPAGFPMRVTRPGMARPASAASSAFMLSQGNDRQACRNAGARSMQAMSSFGGGCNVPMRV